MEPRDDPDDAPERSMVEDADAPGPVAEVDAGARPRRERSSHAVAALLALAAIVAAIVAARVSFLNGEASGKWQLALRTEVKRSAAVLEDVRYLYQTESSIATAIVEARIRQRELLAAATGQPAAVQEALLLEASVQGARVDAFEPSSELASDPAYALPAGGLDLGKRLADLRAKNPDLVALDPHPLEAAGDAAADRALRLTWSGLAIALCVLLGAIAQSFSQWRRPLIAGGAVALGMGVLVALAVELGG